MFPRRRGLCLLALLFGAAFSAAGFAAPREPTAHVADERSGALPAQDGQQLRVTADSGSVRVFTDATREVRYRVRIEAPAGDPTAQALVKGFSLTAKSTAGGIVLAGRVAKPGDAGRVWVSYEVHVPRRYSVEVSTQAGDIVTQDIDGHVQLASGGGNILAGRVGIAGAREAFVARLDTAGGHILVGDVAGSLRASTGGGNIATGNVLGDAILHTGGGHIHVGRVHGAAQFSTGGGNIIAERTGGMVTAETDGGGIELGEAGGAIDARTAGGAIRVARLSGPTKLDSGAGAIFLAGVEAPLHAATATGAITAWFSSFSVDRSGTRPAGRPPLAADGLRRLAGPSDLASGQGDIVIYLPREIALTIDALIDQGSDHAIVADPSLPFTMRYVQIPGGALHARVALNGGGQVLHVRTGAGDIRLNYLDPATERRLAADQMQTLVQGIAAERAQLAGTDRGTPYANLPAAEFTVSDGALDRTSEKEDAARGGSSGAAPETANPFAEVRRMFETLWGSGIGVEPDEQQKRLLRPVVPVYPDAALQAGIEGEVTLRVLIGRDGGVEQVTPLSGEPVLSRSAVNAVAQWRYAPMLLDGRPVRVLTTVTVAFRLR